jgi:nicotinamidase-related amidase
MSFSGYGDPVFIENMEALSRRQVLLAGIETHVCVYQTAVDLLARGYEVGVVADAVSSRKVADRDIALTRMRDEGVRLCSVEMALFELMRTAAHPAFRDVLKIIR